MAKFQATTLILDDDTISRYLIQTVVIEHGVAPVCATDPEMALGLMKVNRPFDVIITDYQMPRMSGREFVNEVRGNQAWRNIPVIMISGIISLKQINDLLGNGVDYFLPKPLDLTEMHHYFQRCLMASSTRMSVCQDAAKSACDIH